ncbi:MAG: RNA polymerase sigma-70 factor [Rhodothermaceae bacterium]|nr:RNA polymerase sigma-70 factor [Rhodothermaceae bacterium]
MDAAEPYASWSRRIAASDEAAFEALFRHLHPPLVRFAAGLVGSEAEADDLVQDAFLRIWTRREQLDPQRSLRALLYRSVRNLAYNAIRDRTTHAEKHTDMMPPPALPMPDAATEAASLDERLRRWMAELPDRQCEALTLSRFDGLSHDEIAAAMEISARTVNNHLVAALKTLRTRILTYEPGYLDH